MQFFASEKYHFLTTTKLTILELFAKKTSFYAEFYGESTGGSFNVWTQRVAKLFKKTRFLGAWHIFMKQYCIYAMSITSNHLD